MELHELNGLHGLHGLDRLYGLDGLHRLHKLHGPWSTRLHDPNDLHVLQNLLKLQPPGLQDLLYRRLSVLYISYTNQVKINSMFIILFFNIYLNVSKLKFIFCQNLNPCWLKDCCPVGNV